MSARLYSSRRRVLWGLFLSLVLILGSVGLIAYLVTQHETEEVFSARLATSARVLEGLLARQLEKATVNSPIVIRMPAELELFEEDKPSASGHPYESKIAFQVWNEDGVLLARSASAPLEMLGPKTAGFHEHTLGKDLWQVFVLQSGPVWIFAAEKNEIREEISEEIALTILIPLAVGSLILLVVVNLLALNAIKPVEGLAKSISERDPSSLEPLTVRDMPVELSPVVKELNSLLNRVHETLSREQRFIDSAAHELRTPIAAIQLHVQNALASETGPSRQASMEQALTASRRAGKLAEQLLAYSRVSASAGMEPKTSFSLTALCREVVATMKPILEERGQTVLVTGASADVVAGEKSKIERLVGNLLDNASQYGSSPGVIGIEVAARPGAVELCVENDGPPIPDAEKSQIFIPYYRLLGTTSIGSGLGLAIVQEIANQHEAEILVENKNEAGGSRFRVMFRPVRRAA